MLGFLLGRAAFVRCLFGSHYGGFFWVALQKVFLGVMLVFESVSFCQLNYVRYSLWSRYVRCLIQSRYVSWFFGSRY